MESLLFEWIDGCGYNRVRYRRLRALKGDIAVRGTQREYKNSHAILPRHRRKDPSYVPRSRLYGAFRQIRKH
ncbi:hypothetical protein M514_11249 [Trichuris suis]|uniref:Uncharacterized protein n=1 Tax=Trichuris suis TaxID=68888 RepID=A0A085N565_9BILA|nr:hypothetical protein M513_11249 [Trichuris suis]KFD64611.1 hypothetical protein M514_11249 [Trichuris suis]